MSNIIPGLSGFTVVRNNILLDYCVEEAIQSLLNVCDQVVVCDSDSTDGTTELLQRMAEKEPRIKLVNFPWTNPQGVSHHFFVDWLNHAREQIDGRFYIYLDADEILDDRPACVDALREAVNQSKSLRVDRLNFWKSPYHLIPDGECCGKWCCRMGPKEYSAISDQPLHPGESKINDEAIQEHRVKIFHLGFLRDQKAFYRKARSVLSIWFNRFDERLESAEKEGKPVWESECGWADRIAPYGEEYFPRLAKDWLWKRGWNVV